MGRYILTGAKKGFEGVLPDRDVCSLLWRTQEQGIDSSYLSCSELLLNPTGFGLSYLDSGRTTLYEYTAEAKELLCEVLQCHSLLMRTVRPWSRTSSARTIKCTVIIMG